MKLTLTSQLTDQVDDIMCPLLEPDKWAAFGLSFAKDPYAIVRMEGAPGTGKTTLANHMARKLRRAPIHLTFAEVTSTQLGETEKKMVETFKVAAETECPTVILEECDAVLWSRDLVSDDTMYQLSFVNTMLQEIDKFIHRGIPSLLVVTTNYPKLLDAAFERRVTDIIKLDIPQGQTAVKMWKSKLPESIVNEISHREFEQLAEVGATPAQMEAAVLKVCRKALRNNTTPTFEDFGL